MADSSFAVAAGHPLAAEEAHRILAAGGSAADAAIGVAFVQGVVDPAKCGLGGWGVATLFDARAGTLTAIDFPGRAGSRARPDMWASALIEPAYHGYLPHLRGAANDVGYRAIAIPAAVPGLGELFRLGGSGRFAWAELLETAIRYARDGVLVSSGVLGAGEPEWDWPGAVPFHDRLAASPAAREAYLPGGRFFEIGEVLRQPVLAATLETLAAEGPAAFTTGSIAARMAADFARNGADITADDLASARPSVGAALQVTRRGQRIGGPWPPESGVSLLGLLARLDGRIDPSSDLLEPPNLEELVEALEFVAAQRGELLADPGFVDVPVAAMLEAARTHAPAVPVQTPPAAGGHTTSVVTIDSDGNAVAMNHSLASHGGSGVMTEGLGFLYNNCMAGFDVQPGRPNSIAPGKARWSAACPAVVVGPDGRATLAITGPGATRAIAAVGQGALRSLDLDEDAATIARATRIDAHDGVVDLEVDAPAGLAAAVGRLGRTGARIEPSVAAALYLIRRGAEGRLDAAADPRRPGGAFVGPEG